MKNITRIVILLAMLLHAGCVLAEKHLDTDNLWIREAPPTSTMLAGYGALINNSDQLSVVTGASSEAFGSVEIHRTIADGDMVRMTRQDRISVAPGDTLRFAPNGYHFMLIDPKRPLRAGDRIPLLLHFDNGDRQTIVMTVRSPFRLLQQH